MFLLYDLIFIIFAVIYFPYTIIMGKWHRGFWARLGFFPKALRQDIPTKKNIWVHAVSVGEVMAVIGLVAKIKKNFPEHRIVLSTVTQTGYRVARSRLGKDDIVIYAPLDFSVIVNRVIRLIRPEIYITAETEIWPNLFLALFKRDIPIVQVNGRISDKGYSRYKMIRFLLKRVLRHVGIFCMQSLMDADRIMALGALPDKVRVVGNIKFDDLPSFDSAQDGEPVEPLTNKPEFRDLGFRDNESLWIAGSTHPGEEDIVLNTFKAVREEFPDLRLVIAPRHVERAREVANLVEEKGFESVALSLILKDKDIPTTRDSVVVVDEIGHLRGLYRLAGIVFVGKSLTVGGGQNIIEPAFFGKPILVGPHMQNFRDIVRLFLKEGGIIQVKDADELLDEVRKLLKDPRRMEALGRRAQEVVQRHQGATHKTQQIISDMMKTRSKQVNSPA